MDDSLLVRGKVREVYTVDDDRLAIVTSDRISAYDVILPSVIPDKGRVLTGLSRHWFNRTTDIVPNHLLSTERADFPPELRDAEHAGRTMLVRRLQMLPIECVARGYLVGSGWADYQATGAVCGHRLPAGLRQADRLPTPIFTPATKAAAGHDENITREQAADLVGAVTLAAVEAATLALYTRAAAACSAAGIILADTKFEFGHDPRGGALTLGDEAVTPDSSRLWPAAAWQVGANPPSFDKQYVRDWLDESGWDHTPPAPVLPDEVVAGTRARYVDAYERLTGEPFADYLRECA